VKRYAAIPITPLIVGRIREAREALRTSLQESLADAWGKVGFRGGHQPRSFNRNANGVRVEAPLHSRGPLQAAEKVLASYNILCKQNPASFNI
jgi:hypothetical protein